MNSERDVESGMGVLTIRRLKDATSTVAVDAQCFGPRASDQRNVEASLGDELTTVEAWDGQ